MGFYERGIDYYKNAGVASALIGSLRMFSGAVASGLISLFFDGTELPMIGIMLACSVSVLLLIQYNKREAKKRLLEATSIS